MRGRLAVAILLASAGTAHAELVNALCGLADSFEWGFVLAFLVTYGVLHISAFRWPSVLKGVALILVGLGGCAFWYVGASRAVCPDDPSVVMIVWSAALAVHGAVTIVRARRT